MPIFYHFSTKITHWTSGVQPWAKEPPGLLMWINWNSICSKCDFFYVKTLFWEQWFCMIFLKAEKWINFWLKLKKSWRSLYRIKIWTTKKLSFFGFNLNVVSFFVDDWIFSSYLIVTFSSSPLLIVNFFVFFVQFEIYKWARSAIIFGKR